MIQFRNGLMGAVALLFPLIDPAVADAAIIQFTVEATVDGARVSGEDGRNLGLEFSYFASGTGQFDTESGTLTLSTSGLSCQGGAGASCGANYAYGTHGPWAQDGTGYLALGSAANSTLDLTLRNPTEFAEEGSLAGLTFGAQHAGVFTVPTEGSPAWVPGTSSVSIMESAQYGYAAKVEQVDNGVFDLNGWFLFSDGIFGSTAAHVESQVGEALFSGSIRLTTVGNPPQTEVPEPVSALLLATGLAGALKARRHT